ncbi:MAG: hypothetical protein Q7J54_08150 [Candidatus Woesearchaeota archaeon]|nr:hypothetical protein [Candidatus Woesearchaeota archaeon]
MFEKFTKKPFKDRLKDTAFLFKNSFTIIGKGRDIKKPTINMVIFSALITTLIFGSILLFILKFVLAGIFVLLFAVLILIPFRFFYNVRQKADQSWLVYSTLCGKDISYKDAHLHTRSEKWKLRLIAFVDILMRYAGSQRGEKKGILGFLINLFLTVLVEIWDLLSHYMLPAVVIEQKPLKDIVPELKALRNNVPAALAGVFGIDFVGNVIGLLLIPIYLVFLAISVGIGYLISLVTQNTAITISGFSFSWVPILIMMYIIFIIGGILGKFVESIKVIYFTIFYTSITRPMAIIPSIRNELTNYLLMKKSDFEPQSPRDQYIGQLTAYIEQYINSGHSREQIRHFLLAKGYPAKDITAAFNLAKK